MTGLHSGVVRGVVHFEQSGKQLDGDVGLLRPKRFCVGDYLAKAL